VNFLNVDFFFWHFLEIWQERGYIKNCCQIYGQSDHGEIEEKHDSVRVLPELPEEIGLVYDPSGY